MPTSGGIYTLPPVYLANPGTNIRAEQHNSPLQDIAAGLTARMMRDGTTPMLADLPMNGRRVSNMGAGVNPSDAARIDQVPVSAFLTSSSALALAANEMVYASGVNIAAKTALTAFARSLLDDTDATTARATLGLAAGALATALEQDDWNTGTVTTEAVISPAKLQAKIEDSQPAAQIVAWVNFNGTGTPAIRASHNVASITDNGAGDYTINFTTPIADANYSIIATAGNNSTPGDAIIAMQGGAAPTASAARIVVHRIGTGAFDPAYVFVQIVR